MGDVPRGYLEHVAVFVTDFDWYIRFFMDVFGMSILKKAGKTEPPRSIWLYGGIQLVPKNDYDGVCGRLDHINLMVNDLAETMRMVSAWDGITILPSGLEEKKWLQLPDGLLVELMQAQSGSVEAFYEVQAR